MLLCYKQISANGFQSVKFEQILSCAVFFKKFQYEKINIFENSRKNWIKFEFEQSIAMNTAFEPKNKNNNKNSQLKRNITFILFDTISYVNLGVWVIRLPGSGRHIRPSSAGPRLRKNFQPIQPPPNQSSVTMVICTVLI